MGQWAWSDVARGFILFLLVFGAPPSHVVAWKCYVSHNLGQVVFLAASAGARSSRQWTINCTVSPFLTPTRREVHAELSCTCPFVVNPWCCAMENSLQALVCPGKEEHLKS